MILGLERRKFRLSRFGPSLACAVEKGELPMGIALCGSGNGISMTLNKHQGIRAALCWTPELAEPRPQAQRCQYLFAAGAFHRQYAGCGYRGRIPRSRI